MFFYILLSITAIDPVIGLVEEKRIIKRVPEMEKATVCNAWCTRALRYVLIDRTPQTLPKRRGVWSENFLLPVCTRLATQQTPKIRGARVHARSRVTRD